MMPEQRERVLIVDDDQDYARSLQRILARKLDVCIVHSPDQFRHALDQAAFHGVLLDVRLGGKHSSDTDGLKLLEEIRRDRPSMPVLVMTGYGTISAAVQAMKHGADDFVLKGEVNEVEVCQLLHQAISKRRELLQLEALAAEEAERNPSALVGASPAMEPVRQAITMAAEDGYCSVLVFGETGVGKEVVARSLHQAGRRNRAPFVAVAIAGLNATLLDSELFGHEKGAFTGASDKHIGYLERADGGVLFLDEIGDLGLELQIKLLRFLEERVICRVGSSRIQPIDVQLVAATHRPLREMIRDGQFRDDLYYRLKTIEVTIPPLRNRLVDIGLLADHFLQILRRQGRTKIVGLTPKALQALHAYEYPGNVRELRAIIDWSVMSANQAHHGSIEPEDLPHEVRERFAAGNPIAQPGSDSLNVEAARAHAELLCIERALNTAAGNKAQARVLLGYSGRHTMRRRIEQIRTRFPEVFNRFPLLRREYGNDSNASTVE